MCPLMYFIGQCSPHRTTCRCNKSWVRFECVARPVPFNWMKRLCLHMQGWSLNLVYFFIILFFLIYFYDSLSLPNKLCHMWDDWNKVRFKLMNIMFLNEPGSTGDRLHLLNYFYRVSIHTFTHTHGTPDCHIGYPFSKNVSSAGPKAYTKILPHILHRCFIKRAFISKFFFSLRRLKHIVKQQYNVQKI